MNSNSFLPMVASTMHTLHTLPRSPVSEESIERQESTLKPIEQASQSSAANLSLSHEAIQLFERDQQTLQKQSDQERQDVIDQQTIQELSTLDREVRNHERAHAAVGGQYAGSPRYVYEKGPDGVNYAVAGEVPISTGVVNGNPQMTIEKAQIIRRAALAPTEPSAQDRKVAAEAVQMEAEAHLELLQLAQERLINEQRVKEEQDMARDNERVQGGDVSHPESISGGLPDDESVESMNKAQEQVFNEINNDLAAQLVALGGVQQTPQTLGGIINRIA